MGRDLGDVLHVLPMHASPGYALVHLGHGHLSKVRLDLGTNETLLVESSPGLDLLGLDRRHIGEGYLDQFVGCEQIAPPQNEGIHRICSRLGGLPILGLLLLEQPNLAILDRFLVVHDLVKGLDHHGLGFDGSPVPPPGQFLISPEHAHFLVADRALLERAHDCFGGIFVLAEALESKGHVTLRLTVAQFEPILFGLSQVVVHGLLSIGVDLLLLEEEAAPVKVQGDGGRQMVILLLSVLEDVAVGLVDPVVQTVQGFDGQGGIDVHSEMPQTAEARRDVKGDVVVSASAREPRPGSVAQLHLLELFESPAFLVVETVVIKENTDVAAGLALVLGLPDPWSLHQGDRLQVLVLFQGTVQSLGALPLVEYPANLGIRIGDLTSQGVGIETVEGLLGTFMGKLHQVRQGHHRIPGRIGNHLYGEVFVLQSLRIARGHQLGKIELLGLSSSNGQGHRLSHEYTP